ncbi:aminomethyl-transferring glycine dehydrogenase subunit GcvPB [Candidatus Sumerlaeota bacterium]|nr:aminomethyl-transferring glycine dehydrogenase subunit GcvPB [Candidatus Sumerlaeota bacterium]
MPQHLYEKSQPGRVAVRFPKVDSEQARAGIPDKHLRQSAPDLPELGELELVRHYVNLSQKNMSIDTNFYPLGSCTMKYNPKINDALAALPGFAALHPAQPVEQMQGLLRLMHEMERFLKEISGLDAVTLQPAAGAHGELTGLMITRQYFIHKGEEDRKIVLVPDSAHGTNPASAALCGFKCKEVPSNDQGLVDRDALKALLAEHKVALLMITNPNTLGLFEENIVEIGRMVHDAGGLLYMDGANMNALLGKALPGKCGVDIMHFNLHKTFSGPHGGGGPGSGPVAVAGHLEGFLPVPRIVESDGQFALEWNHPRSVGKVRSWLGNLIIVIRAYCYIRAYGGEGLKCVAENAVLNANYLMQALKQAYLLTYDRPCAHEFVLSGKWQNACGVHTMDIAKRLIDFGFHPPTVYFPLIVPEAIMIEPTETESKQELDSFIAAMLKIAGEAKETPELVKNAPHTTPVRRLNEVKAAKEPVLTCPICM